MRPAWSDAFAADRLQTIRPLGLPVAIDRAWAFGSGSGAGVRVAIIDSGVDATHPAVGGRVDAVTLGLDDDGQVTAITGPHDDVVGHGTACAAIVRSLAPETDLLSLRVLGEQLTGRSEVFAAALAWAVEHDVHVVNLSLSTDRLRHLPRFAELCDAAAHGGTVIVCAVSNRPGPTIPSQFASVVSVAAHDDRDPEVFTANPTPPADFGAPGIDVRVAWLDGGSIVATGNSFAAPHLAGLVARIVGAHPGIRPYEVKTVLRALARNASAVPA